MHLRNYTLILSVCVALAAGCSETKSPPCPCNNNPADTSNGDPDITQPDTVAPDSTIGDDATDTSVEPDTRGAKFEGMDAGFKAGGLLATYVAGKSAEPQLPDGDTIVQRLEPALDLTTSHEDFALLADGDVFSAEYTGALRIEEAGTYRLIAMVADSIQVNLHGQSVLKVWNAGDQVILETTLELGAGWHPLDIVYARDTYRAHLQLWLAKDNEIAQPLGPTQLGYVDTPPADAKPLSVTAEVGEVFYYKAPVTVTTNYPTVLTVTAVADGDSTTKVVESFTTQHSFSVGLMPAKSYELTVQVTDLWDRTTEQKVPAVETLALPNFQLGGLMGSYYKGIKFETLVEIRLDPRIALPLDADGNAYGSFGIEGLPVNSFSIRWEGGLYIAVPGTYRLYFGTDDGQRLWLDGVKIMDAWANHALIYAQAELELSAGWHPLTAEMYEGGNAAIALLEWEGPGILRQLVPSEALGFMPDPDDGKTPTVTTVSYTIGPDKDVANVYWEASEPVTVVVELKGPGGSLTASPVTAGFWGIVTFSGLVKGLWTATVTATDLNLNVSPPQSLPVVIATPSANATFSDEFEGDTYEPTWQVVNQGVGDNSPGWSVTDGIVRESGNAFGVSPQLPLGNEGTFLWAPETVFGTGTLTAYVRAGDNDGFGLMYGIQDEKTYYRISTHFEQEGGYVRLVRVDNGEFTLLAEDMTYQPPQDLWFLIEMERTGDTHVVRINGEVLLTATDDTYPTGSVALYSWGMDDFQCDFVAALP